MSTHWRRQKVQDHKFDFIDVEDYVDNSFWRKFKYSLVFAVVIKGILIYCADLWTAVNLLVSGTWSTNLGVQNGRIQYGGLNISFQIYKWIFAACIVLSFVLLAWDIKKALAIIHSRDISYAFTSMIAYRYYAIKSYAHFCLFQRIHNSKKNIDEVAFFCFFTFRGWKRLMFADGPRQVINGIILITVINKNMSASGALDLAFWNYQFPLMTKITMGVMTFTLTLWITSVLLMMVAVFLYIPLVLHIQGNLKEFCCHKIDKRIDEIIKKKTKQRAQEAAKNAKQGKGGEAPLQKPTLPNIDLIEEGGRNSPVPGGTPRLAAQTPFTGSPVIRKAIINEQYRRNNPQQPARPYSPAPRSYTPTLEDETDTTPLRHDNHQQVYHNRALRRHDQQYDFSDTRSEISESTYSATSGYPRFHPRPSYPGHRRQPSDTSTVLSGSNHGSVVSGYSTRPIRPHPLQHGHTFSRDNNMGNGTGYGDSVMMTDMSQTPRGIYGGCHGPPSGLGGGVGNQSKGSVHGGSVHGGSIHGGSAHGGSAHGGSAVGGPGYLNQQRGRYQQSQLPHRNRPYS